MVARVDRGLYQVIISKQTKLQLKIFQTWPWFEIYKRQIENPVKIRQMIFVLEKFEKAKIWAVTALSPLTGISSRDSGCSWLRRNFQTLTTFHISGGGSVD